MTDTKPVHTEIAAHAEGEVATVVIDNPAMLNALTIEVLSELAAQIGATGARPDVRAIVLTGAGPRAFSAGADVNALVAIEGPDAARVFIGRIHAVCEAIRTAPVPVVAAIRGYCFGGALEIAAACDLRIAAADAQFGMPEVRLGIPSVVEAALLPTLIGWGRTRRLLYTGETIDAAKAVAWGLVEELTAPADLDAAVARVVADIRACGPKSIRDQKKLMQAWERLPLAEAIAAGADAFADAHRSDEPATMIARFLAERAARKAR
jgi:enoyl-CoA hydratase/carnithine racemase